MYKIVDEDGNLYSEYQYENEAEYEKMIVANAELIFGSQGIYFDIKKKIGKPKEGAAIPDGYYLDLKFHDEPVLYFVEIELGAHDVYGHIGEQVLRFAISSELSKHKIKTILIEDINRDPIKTQKINDYLNSARFNNINELLDKLIFDKEVAVIIVINEASDQLTRVLSKIKISADIIEVQSFISKDRKIIHRFTPFQDDILEGTPTSTDLDDLDTIVVPAREDGFKEVFIGENCWYAIRISAAMLSKIKHIAVYQVAPVSAITHIADVKGIEKYKDTDKYIVYFKGNAKPIKKYITLSGKTKGEAPQAPRYTSYAKLLEASTLDDLWK